MIDPVTGHVTLIDFGLCDFITKENQGKFNRKVGSEEYCPAELLEVRIVISLLSLTYG